MRYRPVRLLILLVYDRIDGRIDLFCPRDGSLQNFLGANLTLDNECGEADGVILAIIGKLHSWAPSRSSSGPPATGMGHL